MTSDARILEVAIKDFVKDVDGFTYWWPMGGGYWPAHALRTIADELDRINKPWEDEINKYFEEHPNARDNNDIPL